MHLRIELSINIPIFKDEGKNSLMNMKEDEANSVFSSCTLVK